MNKWLSRVILRYAPHDTSTTLFSGMPYAGLPLLACRLPLITTRQRRPAARGGPVAFTYGPVTAQASRQGWPYSTTDTCTARVE